MNRKYRIMPMTLYTAILILMDQISKYIIVKTMNIGESISVIGEVLQITSHRNYGAAWGMLQNQMIFFYIITIIVLIALIYFYYKEAADNLLMQCGLMLIFAGAIGNFIDRLFRGNVVDFIDTKIINYDFPIFNVADSCLTIGVFILLYELLFNQKEEKSHGNI
ncbi:signal peptidase II [Macrococcoides caseolyticum]|uniref:Lipoprotein signal peptidase n=3 Tax=Macrococcoides caseolyticum TaxID=69966 RepID=B9EB62_MACCJ|nr:signal peptidase II [Macrococcus caseolyticus]MDJ1090030.1 signal peptidase II [Macrococcus caseolyticus]PKE00079.1 lipoprotein signal peptidase [Macrococcus caseolyticus]PKE12662.1 lipoprotein signal peptidase [Macrococcus caseolyticus]PKE18130.1 lipoprotein signal peptidase [Macrococcus caseolyticus]PKE20389.1 lipoprotein signal peptidase [Macrococcus caseolyticus]